MRTMAAGEKLSFPPTITAVAGRGRDANISTICYFKRDSPHHTRYLSNDIRVTDIYIYTVLYCIEICNIDDMATEITCAVTRTNDGRLFGSCRCGR